MNSSIAITITRVLVRELHADGEETPNYFLVIDHPQARVLVDTGLTHLHPTAADLDPHINSLSEQHFGHDSVDIVVNTDPHLDHCGGSHLLPGTPI